MHTIIEVKKKHNVQDEVGLGQSKYVRIGPGFWAGASSGRDEAV